MLACLIHRAPTPDTSPCCLLTQVGLQLCDVTLHDPGFVPLLARLTSLTSLALEEPVCSANTGPLEGSLTLLSVLSALRSLTVSHMHVGQPALSLLPTQLQLLGAALTALTDLQLWRVLLPEGGPAGGCC